MCYLQAFKEREISIISIAAHITSAEVRWLCLSPGVQWRADLPLTLKKNSHSEKPCYGQLHFFLQILLNWPSPPQVSPIYLCHTSTWVALSHVNGSRCPYSTWWLSGFVHFENCCCLCELLAVSERGALETKCTYNLGYLILSILHHFCLVTNPATGLEPTTAGCDP